MSIGLAFALGTGARRDALLPAHHVRQSRPIFAWAACAIAILVTVATVAGAVIYIGDERARIAAYFAAQDAVQESAAQRITVVYDGQAILCSVPPSHERAAAVVFQGCTALAGALKAAGTIK